MLDNIQIRDKRKAGYYQIDNAVYDHGLSCEALAMYNYLCRYANSDEMPYFSQKKFCKIHKIGKVKAKHAENELTKSGLIMYDHANKHGIRYFTLLNVKKALSLDETGGCLVAGQGAVLSQDTNKTNKQNNHSDSTESGKIKKPKDPELEQRIKIIFDKIKKVTAVNLEGSKKIEGYISTAIKIDGYDDFIIALDGYLSSDWHVKKRDAGGFPWIWSRFFTAKHERARFHAEQTKKKNKQNYHTGPDMDLIAKISKERGWS